MAGRVLIAGLLAAFSVGFSDEPRIDQICSAFSGMGPLRDQANEGGGTTPAPATPAPAPATPAAPPPAPAPAAPKVDTEAMQKATRAEVLKELGYKDESEFKAAREAQKKEADAKLSEGERSQKALREALDQSNTLEAKFKEHKAESSAKIKDLEEKLAMRDTFDEAGVHGAKNRLIVGSLYDAERTSKGDKFKADAFFETTRKEYPMLFGPGTPIPATTATTPAPAASAYGAAPAARPANAAGVVDANAMTPEQWNAFARNGYKLAVRRQSTQTIPENQPNA